MKAFNFNLIIFDVSREDELKRDGWEKRFTTDETRLSEMVNIYKELGFEVLIESFDPTSEQCVKCFNNILPKLYKTIYTRRKKLVT